MIVGAFLALTIISNASLVLVALRLSDGKAGGKEHTFEIQHSPDPAGEDYFCASSE